jgi:hypothetical protein
MPRKWHLIVAICFGMPGATGIAFGKAAGVGTSQYVVIVPISLLLGVACAALLNMIGRTAYAQITAPSARLHNWYLPSFYVAVLGWMVAVGILGVLAASFISRLVR